jgi:hypothetical protein
VIRALTRSADDGHPIVLLGLLPENLERLQANEPIAVNLRHLDPDGPELPGMPDIEVRVFFADEQEAARILDVLARANETWERAAVGDQS